VRARNLRPAEASLGRTTADQEKPYLSVVRRHLRGDDLDFRGGPDLLFGEVYFRQLDRELGPRLQLLVAVITGKRGSTS
jgi:hypothetical protein